MVSKSIKTMQDRIAQYPFARYEPDWLIEVTVDASAILDFHFGEEMIELGYKFTVQALKDNDKTRAGEEFMRRHDVAP